MLDMPNYRFPELAKRLAAAACSYRLGIKSMDYYMRTYATEDVGDYWQELAEQVMEDVTHRLGAAFAPQTDKSKPVQ